MEWEHAWMRGSNRSYTVHVAWEYDAWALQVRHPPTRGRSNKNMMYDLQELDCVPDEVLPYLLADLGFCVNSWRFYHRLEALDDAVSTMRDPWTLAREWAHQFLIEAEPQWHAANAPVREPFDCDADPSRPMADDEFALLEPALPDDDDEDAPGLHRTLWPRSDTVPNGGRLERTIEALIDKHRDAIHALTAGRSMRSCAVLTVDHDGSCQIACKEIEPGTGSAVYACARRLATVFRLPVVIFDRPRDETFVTTVLAPPPAP